MGRTLTLGLLFGLWYLFNIQFNMQVRGGRVHLRCLILAAGGGGPSQPAADSCNVLPTRSISCCAALPA